MSQLNQQPQVKLIYPLCLFQISFSVHNGVNQGVPRTHMGNNRQFCRFGLRIPFPGMHPKNQDSGSASTLLCVRSTFWSDGLTERKIKFAKTNILVS